MADYIDRYLLTKNLCKAICGQDAGLCVAEPKDCMQKEMMAVFDTPTADVALVAHGHWVKFKPVHYQCSVCGINTGGFTSNYCPNCGAKMNMEAPNGLDTP